MVAWSDSRPRCEFPGVPEIGDRWKFRHHDLTGDGAHSGNGGDKVVILLEGGCGVDDFGDPAPDVGDLFLPNFDPSFERSLNGRFAGCFAFGFQFGNFLNDGFGVAAQFGNPIVLGASGFPGSEFRVFGLEESGDEFGICGVAFIATKLLLAEGFNLPGVDEKEAVDLMLVKSIGDFKSVVPGLLETGGELNRSGDGFEPSDEFCDPEIGVVEAASDGLVWSEEVAEEVGFANVDSEKELWSECGIIISVHGSIGCPKGHSKQLSAEESQSHQNRFRRSKMLLGLKGRESCVRPYLVHGIIC